MNAEQTTTDTLPWSAQPETLDAREKALSPFRTLYWDDWLDMQARVLQAFARFQQAIIRGQGKEAVHVADDVITMGVELLHEAQQWLTL